MTVEMLNSWALISVMETHIRDRESTYILSDSDLMQVRV